VNVLAACRSIYRWEGAVETAGEIPLLIKTTAENYPQVEAIVRVNHPYDVPELIATPITHGLPAYLDWVAKETEKHD
jgi:periplasmic divalent cation tolerance protein